MVVRDSMVRAVLWEKRWKEAGPYLSDIFVFSVREKRERER